MFVIFFFLPWPDPAKQGKTSKNISCKSRCELK